MAAYLTPALQRAAAIVPVGVLALVVLGTGAEIFPSDEVVSLGPVKLTVQRLLVMLGVALLLVRPGERGRIGQFHTGLEIPIAVLLLAALASTHTWGEASEPRMRFLVEAVAILYLAVGVVRSRPDWRPALLGVAAIAVALPAVTGLAQVAQEQATGFYRDGCLPVQAAPPEVPDGVIARATGTFANPNVLAGHLLLLAPLAALAALTAVRRERLALALIAGIGYLALILTFSRAAAAIAAGGLVLVALAGGGRRPLALASAGLAIALLATFLLATCGTDAASGDHGRADTWREVVSLAREEPLTGHGLGRVADVLRVRNPDSTFVHGHNLWLTWWAEAGTGALLAWLAIAAILLWRSLRAARAGDVVSRAVFVALAGFFAFSLLDHPANVDRVAVAFWVVAGLAVAGAGRGEGATGEADPTDATDGGGATAETDEGG